MVHLFILFFFLAFLPPVIHSRCTGDIGVPTRYKVFTEHFEIEYPPDTGFKRYFVKSVGYSPAPPTWVQYEKPYGDFYTDRYGYLYNTDLQIIREMGANTVRLWNWNYMGSRVEHHSDFLDACWNNNRQPLRVFIPFNMGAQRADGRLVYDDLEDADTRRNALSDWATLVEQYWRHPAIFAWFIGNELDVTFAAQLDALFSLANLMIQVAKEVTRGQVQPITMPLSETAFVRCVGKFYAYSHLSFWAVQSYDKWTTTPKMYQNHTIMKVAQLKPLVFTEFGHSSIFVGTDKQGNPYQKINDTYQATEVMDFITNIEKYPVVAGYSVMEFVDEWWKTAVDFRNPECPNRRTDIHTTCATYIYRPDGQIIAIHEAWLGMFTQTLPKKFRSYTEFCIQPKALYFALAKYWKGKSVTGEQCRYHRYADPVLFMFVPMMTAVILELLYLVYYKMFGKRKAGAKAPQFDLKKRPEGSQLDLTAVDEPVDDAEMGTVERPFRDASRRDVLQEYADIQDRVSRAFEPFQPRSVPDGEISNVYSFQIRRISTAVWDHVTAFDTASQPDVSFDEVVDRGIRMLYIKQMEGYYIWLQNGEPESGRVKCPGIGHPEPDSADQMLYDIALYDIVLNYSGTITHCPEKIMEIYHFTTLYLENVSDAAREATRRNLHLLMRDLFRVVFCYIGQKIQLDDINSSAVPCRAAERKLPFSRGQMDPQFDAPTPEDEVRLYNSFNLNTYKQILKQIEKYQVVADPPLSGFTKAYLAYLDPKAKVTSEPTERAKHTFWVSDPGAIVGTPISRLLYGSMTNTSATSSSTAPKETDALLSGSGGSGQPSSPVGFFIPEMPRAFTQRGGFPTTFYNCGWLIRLILWVGITAWYFQPAYPYTPVCLPDALAWLALLDASLRLVLELCHWRLFFKQLLTFGHFASAIYRICASSFIYVAFLEYQGYHKHLPPLPVLPNVMVQNQVQNVDVKLDFFTCYLALEGIKVVVREASHFSRTYAYALPGRLFKQHKKFFAGAAIGGSVGCITSGVGCWLIGIGGEYAVPITMACTLFAALVIAIPTSKMFGWKENTIREVRYLVHNTMFWGTIWAATFFVFYEWIVPVVIKVRPDTLCQCPDEQVALTEHLRKRCKFGSRLLCTAAVVMVWLSVIVINFVWVFACFQLMLLVYGIGRGKRDRVGNVKSWSDVQKYFASIKTTCFPALSGALRSKHNQMTLWNWYLKSLYNEWLLDAEEYEQLKITCRKLDRNETVKWDLDEVEKGIKFSNPLFLRPPKNEEAARRVIYFLWSLQAIAARDRSDEKEEANAYRKNNRVISMPSVTILTPCAAEPVLYSIDDLISTHHRGDALSTRNPRISGIEYVQCIYQDEWENFVNWLKVQLKENPDRADASLLSQSHHQILRMFMDEDPRLMSSEYVVYQIRLWSSYHGQTLVRLIRGIMGWRRGLELLLTMENGEKPESCQLSEQQIIEVVTRKFQFIICHQVFGTKACQVQTKDMLALFDKTELGLHRFDMVFPDDGVRFRSKIRQWTDGREYWYNRCGPLRPNDPFPTEPKAENQNHAIPFIQGEVFCVLDMNQTGGMEESFKLPFLISRYFSPRMSVLAKPFTSADLRAQDVVNRYRVVGYAEWQYTRGLSVVGEVAGQAEYCFTTIHQRVCRWPLRSRLHYGHPDFVDAHWARTRGGLSHASHLVNTAEDVFLGYEVVGRGERIEYVEWIQAQKGKESAIGPAFLFEKKLAQAAAQQMRSRDIYHLNKHGNVFLKFGCFFGTYGFFIYNTLMALSIHLYIQAIVFFALSGVTDHDLGINQSSLAVPWLFQVGFLFSFPLIVETSIEKGIMTGILHFIKTLPFALLYHLFQLQTKCAFFIEGLVRGKGGYIASQRGFGLDRLTFTEIYVAYASSHIHPSINLLSWVVLFTAYSQLTFGEIFLRCLFMFIVVTCWIGAPIIFNPYPTMEHLIQDIHEMLEWLATPLPETKDIAFMLFEEHKRRDVMKKDGGDRKVDVSTKTLQNWVANQRSKSWQSWYMSEVLLGPWSDEEMWFSTIVLLMQKSTLGFISYTPWLLFSFWACPSIEDSIWYAIPLLLGILFFGILNHCLPHLHDAFNILKMYVPGVAFVSAIYFIHAWKVTAKEILFNLLFYIICYAMLIDITISCWNFNAKFKNWWKRSTFGVTGFVTRPRTAQHDDSLWYDRLVIPRFLFDIQKVYPVLALCLFTCVNGLLCLGNNTLTALCYSPAVANAWRRAASRPHIPKQDKEE